MILHMKCACLPLGHFLLSHPMVTSDCPIPLDFYEISNTNYIILWACPICDLNAVVAKNPKRPIRGPMKLENPFFRCHLKRAQKNLYSRPRITAPRHWASTCNNFCPGSI